MILSIELTDTEYKATMKALGNASRYCDWHKVTHNVGETSRLELLHLMTLMAQAATTNHQDEIISNALYTLDAQVVAILIDKEEQ